MVKQKIPSHEEILDHFDDRDPVIAAVVREYGPMQLKRNRNYFVVLCKAIIGQQISIRAAESHYRPVSRLVRWVRRRRLKECWVSTDEGLRSVGFVAGKKVAYIQDLARHFQEKIIRPRQFHYLNDEEVIQKLIQVHGIGRWTAEMFLIFSLMRMNVFPCSGFGIAGGHQEIVWHEKNAQYKKNAHHGEKVAPLPDRGHLVYLAGTG